MLKGSDTRKKVVSLLFAILPGKSEAMYNSFFAVVKKLAKERIQLESVVMDFEQASQNALHKAFPGQLNIWGCFFYFCHSVSTSMCRVVAL
jgi:hypothetical protein